MKYVVTGGLAAGKYTRGQVVDEAMLGNRLTKCLRLRIVRPATEEEARHERVTVLARPAPHGTYEERLAQAEKDHGYTKARVAELEAALRQSREQAVIVDQALHASRRQVKELEKQVEELENELTKPQGKPSAKK